MRDIVKLLLIKKKKELEPCKANNNSKKVANYSGGHLMEKSILGLHRSSLADETV